MSTKTWLCDARLNLSAVFVVIEVFLVIRPRGLVNIDILEEFALIFRVKVKQTRYRPGVAQGVPGS